MNIPFNHSSSIMMVCASPAIMADDRFLGNKALFSHTMETRWKDFPGNDFRHMSVSHIYAIDDLFSFYELYRAAARVRPGQALEPALRALQTKGSIWAAMTYLGEPFASGEYFSHNSQTLSA